MRIYKDNKSGYYYLDCRDEGGRRLSLKTKNKKYAEAIMAQKRTELLQNKFSVQLISKESKNMTLAEAVKLFLEYCKIRVRKSTVKRYATSSEQLMEGLGKSILLKEINNEKLESYRRQRLEDGKSVATVNRDLQFLRNLFNKMEELEYIEKKPFKKIKMLKENNIVTRVLSVEEATLLLDHCNKRSDYLYYATFLALNTGMRKNEILSLQLPDREPFQFIAYAQKNEINWINLQGKRIILNYTKNHKPRTIPMNDDVFDETLKYLGSKKTGPVFPVMDFKKSFNSAVRDSRIEKCTFHDLRRTFESWAARAGFTREAIQSITGQISESVYKRYAHFDYESKSKVVKNIGRILAEKTTIKKIDPITIGIEGAK